MYTSSNSSSIPISSSILSSSSFSSLHYFDDDTYEKRIKMKNNRGRNVIFTSIIRMPHHKNQCEAYRSALHAFLQRRKNPNDPGYIISPNSPDKARLDFFMKNNNDNNTIKINNCNDECSITVCKLPNANASEIFEIGWVAGTEDRYIDIIYAEWQSTKVCLRRHTHPDCKYAVKEDLNILGEIRHPNILLLMGTTQTDDHGIIAILEPINCTLFNYIHEQGERVTIQGIVKCTGSLASAIKHAHLLGYIHSAISSHCVFLDSNGIVKLGGWELAINANRTKVVRNYEERLRSEIFRWQAPELFYGEKITNATDVYGLTLLMWEMCTMDIPWSNFNITEVERQYVAYKQGIITDIYNFPPLLNNLLEAGLQIDISKRTLDMIKMNRFLQRLEMHYENEKPIYIGQLTNNNDEKKSNFTTPSNITPRSKDSALSYCHLSKVTRELSKKLTRHSNENDNKIIEKKVSHENISDNKRNHIKIVNEVYQSKSMDNSKLINNEIKIHDDNQSKSMSDYYNDKNIIGNLTDDDIYIDDSRLSIKKLKETLATKRKDFFSEDSSMCDQSNSLINEISKTSILSQVRSKDYKPHKPASHKTSIEPKQITTSPQYPTYIPRSSYKKNQRSPYSYVPTLIRNAVIQPQILNSDSQSFFETSLWRKEKSMCQSKMNNDNTQNYSSSSNYHTVNMEIQKSNDTFTLDDNQSIDNLNVTGEYFSPINDNSVNITASTIPRSKSLQALKDALERATDLVKSINPIKLTSIDPSYVKYSNNFNKCIDNSNTDELIYDELAKVNVVNDGNNDNYVRSTSRNTFTIESEQLNNNCGDDELQQYNNNCECQSTLTNNVLNVLPFTETHTNIRCKPIGNIANEHDTVNMIDNELKNKHLYHLKCKTMRSASQNEVIDEKSDKCYYLFPYNDAKVKECLTCSRSGLIRRRSLPVGLEQLTTCNYTSLGKCQIIKGDLPDATVEDLYIDDEFSENSLAPNMILMNENTTTDDENYYSDLIESKAKYLYS